MAPTRAFLLAFLCMAQAGHAALAGPLPPAPPGASPVIEVQARKGTRLYTPDGAVPTAPDTSQEQTQDSDAALEQCMNTWDAGTHITKSKWREICKRQLNDRDSMYR